MRPSVTDAELDYEWMVAMHLPSECQEAHVRMEGRTKQLRSMQNYEEGFVEKGSKGNLREYG